MSTPELQPTPTSEPVPKFGGIWTGVFWGSSRGIAKAEITQSGNRISGKLMFTEPLGSYHTELDGEVDGSNMNAQMRGFSSATVTGLPQTGDF